MNFTIDELIYSETAKRYHIDNCPSSTEVYNNLMRLVVDLLQPLRDYLKKPIIITSGYRSHDINVKVGGSLNSQHLIGQAVDFHVKGMSFTDLCHMIKGLKLPFDQMIIYDDKLHVSLRATNNRKEVINYVTNNG